jgi:hypothetical protein
VVDVDLLPVLGQHRVREVTDGDGDVAVAEVDPDRGAGGRRQRDQDGRAPDLRLLLGVALAFDDEAGALQVRDEARHGRPGQPGDPGDLRPARYTSAPERLDNQAPVGVAKRLQSANALHPSQGTLSRTGEFVKSSA